MARRGVVWKGSGAYTELLLERKLVLLANGTTMCLVCLDRRLLYIILYVLPSS